MCQPVASIPSKKWLASYSLVIFYERKNDPAYWSIFIPDVDGSLQGALIHAIVLSRATRSRSSPTILRRPRKPMRWSAGIYTWRLVVPSYIQGFECSGSWFQQDTVGSIRRKSICLGEEVWINNRMHGESYQNWLEDYISVLVRDGVIS